MTTTPHKLTPWLPLLFVPLYVFVLLQQPKTLAIDYSADGMEFSNNTYTHNAKIDRHTTTNTHRGNQNSQLLKTNTQGFTDVVKQDGGNVDFDSYWNPSDIARMDVLSSDQSSLEAKINALVASGLSPEEIKKSLKNNADLKALLKDGDSKFDAIYDAQKAKVDKTNKIADNAALALEVAGVGADVVAGGVGALGKKQIKNFATELTKNQLKNLKRFTRKIPANSKNNIKIYKTKNGRVIIEATSPGKVPGSKAVYRKILDKNGKTIGYDKKTYAPDGRLVHKKDKFNNVK